MKKQQKHTHLFLTYAILEFSVERYNVAKVLFYCKFFELMNVYCGYLPILLIITHKIEFPHMLEQFVIHTENLDSYTNTYF